MQMTFLQFKKTQNFGTNKGMPREIYFLKEKLMINFQQEPPFYVINGTKNQKNLIFVKGELKKENLNTLDDM